MSDECEYEVAFSFLHQDEQLAIDVADRIRDRVKAFIYSEQQKELIASDGVDSFSQVFTNRARVVVILFRETWGTTKWTRVEETAIKSRHLNEGPKFLIVASLDGNHPIWYPDTWIWGDLQRYGIDGLASVIETKVRQMGGEVHSETLADYAANIERQITFASDLRRWRNSYEGVENALEEVNKLFDLLQQACKQISTSADVQTQLQFAKDSNCFASVSGWNVRFSVSWGHQYGNTLEYSGLSIVMSEGGRFFNRMAVVQPQEIARMEYQLDWDRSRRIGWREEAGDKVFYSSAQLTDVWIRRILDHLRDRAVKSEP